MEHGFKLSQEESEKLHPRTLRFPQAQKPLFSHLKASLACEVADRLQSNADLECCSASLCFGKFTDYAGMWALVGMLLLGFARCGVEAGLA
ncbi:hypothetical protein Nepgr_020394 [Nepenthes gracilis]|uniref:Uncharacterized protein n=1 Tax=Nepenthes gracilis TaxID=150966 RepID=A0AAD3XV70_NEPGR|nr:hypothetical protein Nepgr_020394 [Nepenthes gracilis]